MEAAVGLPRAPSSPPFGALRGRRGCPLHSHSAPHPLQQSTSHHRPSAASEKRMLWTRMCPAARCSILGNTWESSRWAAGDPQTGLRHPAPQPWASSGPCAPGEPRPRCLPAGSRRRAHHGRDLGRGPSGPSTPVLPAPRPGGLWPRSVQSRPCP